MQIVIFKNVILNVGLLVVIAQLLARIYMVKKYVVRKKHKMRDQIVMIMIFSTISILSTYMGVGVKGAIANTRVIGVIAGGVIGGPVVGICSAILASVHRYIIDINGFAAFSCALSTMMEGIIAAVAADYIKKTKYKEADIFLLTFTAEILQMIIILIFAKPYIYAVALVREIALPMILLNSVGTVLFVGVFKHIFNEQEYEVGKKLSLTFDITKKCLPLLRSGLYNKENCNLLGESILESTKELAILFTDNEKIISVRGKLFLPIDITIELPGLVHQIYKEKKVCISEEASEGDILHRTLDKMVAIGAPLTRNGEAFGCMILFFHKYKISFHSDVEFVDGLSKLFSTQIELSQIEKQHEHLQKAEFHALQSQINPHFIFNSLNTISAFCREKPDKARKLLIALATYFRNSIQTQDGFVSIYDEMDYVKAYLQLEKARFDERLQLTIEIPNDLECKMPCLILQPIVENAVIHGAMKKKQGEVKIIAKKEKNVIKISVIDNGFGIAKDIIERLKSNTIEGANIGLSNVHKRLCYIYGKDNGLEIISSTEGTTINLYIPY